MPASRLFTRDFTLMTVGQIISLFGNAILRFALSLHVLALTGSAAVFGGILALSMVPTALLSPLGGILADRMPRARIMVILDFSTCAFILLFDALFARSGNLAAVTLFMVLLSLIQAVYQPSVQASVPTLVAEERLTAANGVVLQVQALTGLLGPVLGGILMGFFGIYPILAVSAGCFFGSAVLELFLHIPFTPQPRTAPLLIQARDDLAVAFRFLSRDYPALLRLLGIVALINLFLSSLFTVGLPYLVKVHLGLSDQLYGLAEAALGLGSILGGLLSATTVGQIRFESSHRYLLCNALLLLPVTVALVLPVPPLVSYGALLLCSPVPHSSPSRRRPFFKCRPPPRCWAKWALWSPPSPSVRCRRARPCTVRCSMSWRLLPGWRSSWAAGPPSCWHWPPVARCRGASVLLRACLYIRNMPGTEGSLPSRAPVYRKGRISIAGGNGAFQGAKGPVSGVFAVLNRPQAPFLHFYAGFGLFSSCLCPGNTVY